MDFFSNHFGDESRPLGGFSLLQQGLGYYSLPLYVSVADGSSLFTLMPGGGSAAALYLFLLVRLH